jgi:hypothetical protein
LKPIGAKLSTALLLVGSVRAEEVSGDGRLMWALSRGVGEVAA